MYTATTSRAAIDNPIPRPLLPFFAIALAVGELLLTQSTLIEPRKPFILATVVLALAIPALAFTHREAGGSGVRAAARCDSPPQSLVVTAPGRLHAADGHVAGGERVGRARPVTLPFLTSYLLDVVLIAVLINLWEEGAWTG